MRVSNARVGVTVTRIYYAEAARLEAAALAPSTGAQYLLHVQWWWRWLLVFGLEEHGRPPPEWVLSAYLAFLARSCAAGSAHNYLKGLKHFYSGMGVSLDWAGFVHLRRQLAGLRRLKGEGAGRKLAIRPPLLLHMAAVLPGGSRWHALFVCCVFWVLGMLRRSNLVPGALSLFGQEKHLTRADITIDGA
jgi:hypothetical protein